MVEDYKVIKKSMFKRSPVYVVVKRTFWRWKEISGIEHSLSSSAQEEMNCWREADRSYEEAKYIIYKNYGK